MKARGSATVFSESGFLNTHQSSAAGFNAGADIRWMFSRVMGQIGETDAALTVARSVGYRNAGTIEFLLEGTGDAAQFYFLEAQFSHQAVNAEERGKDAAST